MQENTTTTPTVGTPTSNDSNWSRVERRPRQDRRIFGLLPLTFPCTGRGLGRSLALVRGEWVGLVAKAEFPHAIPTRVVWAREDETSHWIFAGLEFLNVVEA